MKKIEFTIGFLVIIALLFALVSYTFGELPNAQTANSSIYNTTQTASSFWFSISGIITILMIMGVVALMFAIIAYLSKMFGK